VRSKVSSNQILLVLILYSKVSLGFAKGENLGLVPIWDKSSFFDLLPRFRAQKSQWWERPAARRSEPFRHDAVTMRSGVARMVSSTQGRVTLESSWAALGKWAAVAAGQGQARR
jgi:hypothetical protein